MSRVVMYLAGLVVVLGAAFALGSLFGGGEGGEHGGTAPATHASTEPATDAGHHEAGHGEEIGGSHGEAARGPRATDRHDLELELAPSSLRAGRRGELSFRILDAGGEPVSEFEVSHTKQVHLIVVGTDLHEFHHVHPEVSGRGTWRAPIGFANPGGFRVIADVTHEGRKLALTGDLEVAGRPQAVGQPASEATFEDSGPLRAGQPATLRFRAPGRTQPYLGAAGHLVILAEDDLEYLHVHPHGDELAFETTFPEPGRYVMFLEYRRGGEVRLSRFEVTAS